MFPIQDSVPSRSVPVVTRALILINVVVFFFELSLSRESIIQLFYLFGVVPARFTDPEWAASIGFPIGSYWSLLTHQFLHGGWLHIVANMWTLWIFGDNVEDRMGPLRFIIFYLVCGVLAALTQVLVTPNATIPSVGASGAIAGVLGAYFLFFPTARLIVLIPILFFPFFFELPAVIFLVLWFFIQLFSGTAMLASPQQVGGIAFWAHIGGFIAGMLLCRFFVRRPVRRRLQSDEYGLEWAWEPRER
ncbi:MAG: rhomboid family intramembrane serine protease [Verrucomicrobia bacterium 13_2_20CM_55_10]|nr:MAG: rhomboid family intramembrane serine protease [Verrucomicrobia bacterium 13_2_20CM_55_10]